MNQFGTLVLLVFALGVAAKAYSAQAEVGGMWEFIARVLGAVVGSSIAVVFHFGEDRATSLKRFFIGFAFAMSTSGTTLAYMQRHYGFTSNVDDWLFVSTLLGALGYLVTSLVYSQAMSDLFKRAIDSWKR